MREDGGQLGAGASIQDDAASPRAPVRLFRDPIRMRRIPELDGLRALLAWWVVVYHARGANFAATPDFLHGPQRLLSQGSLAVAVFMILSGFVIFFLLDREHETYRNFVARRFLRLHPVFALCFVAMLGLHGIYVANLLANAAHIAPDTLAMLLADAARVERDLPAQLAVHAVMLHGAVPASILPNAAGAFLTPAWSISLEWQFYLIAPFVYWLARAGGAAGAALWALVTLGFFATRSWWPEFSFDAFLPLQLHYFSIGIGSYYALKWITIARPRPRLLSWGPWAVVAGVAALVAIQIVRLGVERGSTPGRWFPTALWAFVFAVVAAHVGGADGALSRGVRRVLQLRPLERLGVVSYSTYLVHWPVMVLCQAVFRGLLDQPSPTTLWWLHVAVSFPLIVASSLVLYRFVEAPAMAFGRRITHRSS